VIPTASTGRSRPTRAKVSDRRHTDKVGSVSYQNLSLSTAAREIRRNAADAAVSGVPLIP